MVSVTRDNPPRSCAGEVTFSLFLCKIQQPFTLGSLTANLSRGLRQLGWASCLALAGRVTLASGTIFFIKALARLTGITLGEVSVVQWLD